MLICDASTHPKAHSTMIDNDQVSSIITRWGNSAAISLLDARCQFFSEPGLEGVIGYYDTADHAVVFSDPVCPTERLPQLTRAFHQDCLEKKRNIIYLTASEDFVKWTLENGCCQTAIEVEEELMIDPASYPKKGPNGRLLHKKFNHAAHEGVVIKEYIHGDEELKAKIQAAEISWLKSRKGPQIFVSQIDFFENFTGKRCFYAEQNGQIVGAMLLMRLEAEQGWMLYLLMALPNAPGGTSEALVMTAFDQLALEGCHSFSFGISAAENIGGITGLGKLKTWCVRTGFTLAKKIFPLDTRRVFWKKFEPQSKRSCLLFSQPKIGYKAIKAILKTVNASLR